MRLAADHSRVDCEAWRELLSARLDGEDDDGRAADLDAHLAGCADCRRWLDRAARVTRLARTQPAEPGPDVADVVLAAVPLPRRGRALRWLLGVVGVVQAALGVVILVAGRGGGHAEMLGAAIGHLSHESAAWSLALGVAFGWAALRLRLAGLVPAVATFTVAVFGLTMVDLVSARVEPARVVPHLVSLIGLVLLVRLEGLYPQTPLDSPRPRRRPRPEPHQEPRTSRRRAA